MTEEEWLVCADPKPMLKVVKEGVSERKLRLFAVACCRNVGHLIEGECDRNAIEVAERVADGLASNKERRTALHASGSGAVASATLYADVGIMVGFVRQRIAEEVARSSGTHAVGQASYVWDATYALPDPAQSILLRDIFGNQFRSITADPAWLTDTAVSLARGMYESRDFSAMPILADALQDAGCDNTDMLNHCRDASATHVRGCWVVDLVLGKS